MSHTLWKRGSVLLALAAILLGPAACRADIAWNITFLDVDNNTGIGFDDAVLGTTRQNTFLAVTDYLDTVLDHTGPVDLVVQQSEMDGTGALGFAGAFMPGGPNGTYNGAVFEHATTGLDPIGGVEDAQATFDFGTFVLGGNNFSLSSSLAAPEADEFDLFSVALHEVTHALGFGSAIASNGQSVFGGDPGVFAVFDDFLIRGSTLGDIVTAAGDFVGSTADLISNDLFFNGPNAVAANGGSPVEIYAPNPFVAGRSLSHIVQPGAVMQFAVLNGVQRREYSDQELGILADLGWNVTPAAVPEPSSAMLLGLVGLTGVIWRKRRSSCTPPSQA